MEERDLLVKQVFPELRRKARERGVEVLDVDLRWGITEEESRQGKVIPICLGEIDRCRPYFVGMLGERYGWIPPADQYSPQVIERQPWLNDHLGGVSVTELEILHGVLNDPAMAGRAFFYFRDPAWSTSQSEPGFVCETAEEEAKLVDLKQRIRASAFPVAENLADPKVLADQIGRDFWDLIQEKYPDFDEADSLEREERQHASYRRSRLGVYLGGKRSINQLERWIDGGQQKIMITGESGAGKSALIANWMEAHHRAHPDDLLYAHHLGCSNDASAIRPLLARLIDTAKQQLPEVYGYSLSVPQDWWELVAKAVEALQSLGRWAQQNNHRWIWVLDGLDRLAPDDQNALPWLPLTIPEGVVIVASALECPAREILLERKFKTRTIAPLKAKEQDTLIQQYLGRYTKQLIAELRQTILKHPLAGSPLFLRVLLEELRQCGRYETLADQLDGYLTAETIDDLYERLLERLEVDGYGKNVRKVMTALWASRAGLSEEELLSIAGLKTLEWAPIDLGLEEALGRNGNHLVFDHDYLRKAVEDRYLPTEEERRQAHSDLADWFASQVDWDERKAEEWPWQLLQADRKEDLRALLLNVSQLFELSKERDDRETINYWLAVEGLGDGKLDELIGNNLQEEIEKRREKPEDLIRFVDCFSALFDEGGLYRDPLLKLRALSLELKEGSDQRSEESMLSSLALLANAYRDLGQYDSALPLYQRSLEACERLLGPEHPSTLATVGNLGLLYTYKGDYEQAKVYSKRDLEASERMLGPEHPATLASLNNLGLMYSNMGDYEQAGAYYKRGLEASERLLGPEHPDTLITTCNLGTLYRDSGDLKQSEIFYRRCLEAQEHLLGPEHPHSLITLGNLGGMFSGMGDYEQASSIYKRCLDIQERLLGPEHPNNNGVRIGLSDLLSCQGQYHESIPLRRKELEFATKRDGHDATGTLTAIFRLAEDLYWADELEEAEQLYREALVGRIAALGDDDGATMASRYGLARCLSALERYEEAIELRRVELAWCQADPDGDTADMLVSMHGLGSDLLAAGEQQEALDVLQECLSQRQSLLGQTHDDTLSTMARVLEALCAQGRQRDAIALSQQAYQAIVESHGEAHPEAHTQLGNQASLHEELGELEQAEELYRRCLAGREEALGSDHSDTLSTMYDLAHVLSQQERHAEAIPLRRRELAWSREQHGDTDPGTLTSINSLAIDLREIGDLEEAETLFRELVTARQQVLEPGDFGIGRTLGGLAKTLEAAGKLEEALSYAQLCLDHRLEHQGPDDWHTNRNRLDLARVLHKLGRNTEAVKLLLELQASMGRNDEPDDDDRQLMGDAAALKRNIDEGQNQNS
jgi:tetratricopeptide (TPR) repeat protein